MEKGSSSSSGSGTDSLNYLNFGEKVYFEGADSRLQPKSSGGMLQSPAKRGRNGAVQSSQPPRCQVEGCQLDLSDAKAYYSRHKVCGMHSKSPKVTVGGLEQRFCQQCSRFHQLPEFDQVKRSCRRRLAGHNERRRKPPPGPFFSSSYRSLPSNADSHSRTGGLMMDFSSYSVSAGEAPSGGGLGNQATYTGKYMLPWQNISLNPPSDLMQGSTTIQPCYLGPGVPLEEHQFSAISDSTSALSLLSNQPWIPTNQSSSLNLLGTNDAAATAQPLGNHGTAMSQFPFHWWGFKRNQATNALQEMMPPDSGFDHTPHPPGSSQCNEGHTTWSRPNDRSKYGVEVKASSGGYDDYDDSVEHLQWSL